jgi:hypothetical protein
VQYWLQSFVSKGVSGDALEIFDDLDDKPIRVQQEGVSMLRLDPFRLSGSQGLWLTSFCADVPRLADTAWVRVFSSGSRVPVL